MKRTQKTLIVEDSNFQAEVLESMLHDIGIEHVTRAANGVQALEQFKSALKGGTPYALVFLDIVMPEMDGQEALKRIRALEKDAEVAAGNMSVIIMTTILNSPNDMLESLIGGDCTDYIVKPLDEENLRCMLSKYDFI